MPENFPKIITIKIAKSINSIDRSLMVWTVIFKQVCVDRYKPNILLYFSLIM